MNLPLDNVGLVQPPAGLDEIPAPPEPTITNFLDGLNMFWGNLNAGNGDFSLGASLLHLKDFTFESFSEDTKRALSKKGWLTNPIDKGAMFTGTF